MKNIQRRKPNSSSIFLLVMLATLMIVSPVLPQSSGGKYQITSSVVAGGGSQSTGGNKIVEGAAGQLAAGGPATGASISHVAGFWPTTVTQPFPSAGGSPTFQFSSVLYSVPEDLGSVTLTVTRSGDSAKAAAVDYRTNDQVASQKTDFEYAAGTLTFAPGETSKTIQILINEDAYAEGNEVFNVSLSNPVGASLGQAVATVAINDDAPESSGNPINDAQAFVYMHYHDFLNREPDPEGLAFWTNQIIGCGANPTCIDAARTNVSAAFYLSIEFQQTGYLLYLMQKESFGTMPQYTTFMRDLQEVGRGVIVKAPGWQQTLTDKQQQFAETWASRPEFKARYDGMANADYVNALYANAGIPMNQANRDALVARLDSAIETRAAALLEVAGNAQFRQKEQNAAFVLMQYFGYLRRDANAPPDSDLSGYNFWLIKLDQFGGDFVAAEMVRSFIISSEYRQRFGQ